MAKTFTLRYVDPDRAPETAQPVQAILAGTVFANGVAVVEDKTQADRLLKLKGVTDISGDDTPADAPDAAPAS
ncbi:hypothetical protein [Tessaracoccus sp.]